MSLFLDIFGRPAPIGVRETLKVLDCSDIAPLEGRGAEGGASLSKR